MVWIDLMTALPSATPWFQNPQGFFSAGDLRHMDAHLVGFYRHTLTCQYTAPAGSQRVAPHGSHELVNHKEGIGLHCSMLFFFPPKKDIVGAFSPSGS